MWLISALVGHSLLAVVLLLDKKILQTEVKDPIVYTFYSATFLLLAGVFWFMGVPIMQGVGVWVWASVSGVAFGVALWTMFIGLKKTAATHLDPFIGAVVTLATFVGGYLFLQENLSVSVLCGLGILIVASLLLTRDGRVHSVHGYLWGAASGISFGLAHLTAKLVYAAVPFLTGLVATRVTIGVFGLFLLLSPTVWRSFTKKARPGWRQAQQHLYIIVGVNKLLSIAGIVLIQFAIARGSVTIVNALSGVQYALLFILVLIISKVRPRWFREKFSTSEIIRETIAVLLVLVGLYLVALP